MRPRQLAPVALVLGLTVATFIVARHLGERNAGRESEHRAEVAAAQVRDRITQAASLTESLRRFMLNAGGTGVTSDEFARNALRWLSPADFPGAAWVEQVPGSRRAAYERQIGQPMVTPDGHRRVVAAGSRSSYLPATLVSGFPPLDLPGIDLSGEPRMAPALARASRLNRVVATPVVAPRAGTSGLFLVAPAPNLVAGVLHPGYVLLFVPDATLRAATTDPRSVRITTGGASPRASTASRAFTTASQRFGVVVPREPVQGAAAALPWIVLAAGLVLSALAAALGLNRARRARTQEELDRLFTLSSDMIAVADFNGYFTRVNPAAERILGYTTEELVARPYLDFVHPDDREQTAAEAAALGHGKMTLGFENRYVRKDGSYRVLEWTVTPVVEERLLFSVARDVTERRQVEAEVGRLADEQAALRRVATLVAREASEADVFGAIADEIRLLLGTGESRLFRYEDDRTAVVVARSGSQDVFAPGSPWQLDGDTVISRVLQTGRTVRIDDYQTASGLVAETARSAGISSAVGAPILVDGRLWGAIVTASVGGEPPPPETESRLGHFTELMATAIGNTESHARAERLTDEQASLRRVATLIAEDAPPAEVFKKVAEEVANAIGDVDCALCRIEPDGTIITLAARGAGMLATIGIGGRFPVDGDSVVARVVRDGRPCRIDDYAATTGTMAERDRHGIRSAAGCPIVVAGRTWGVVAVANYDAAPLPPQTETRVKQFTDLVATAIANAEARAEVERLAREQAALRRVATLVAEGAAPTAVFDAVAAEIERLLDADEVVLSRYELGGDITVVAYRGATASRLPPGSRLAPEGESVTVIVRRTERPARVENDERPHDAVAGRMDMRVSVGTPIIVDGRPWGAIAASWGQEASPPDDTEVRMAQFAQLLDTAIANADSRDQLTASRARLLTEGDDARRRVVRDLHDGAQQRLVHSIVTLKLAQRALRENGPDAESLVGEALEQAEQGQLELRELAHGMLPTVLTRGGLLAGIDAVVGRLELPVDVDVPAERFQAEIEASTYFIVTEALTNAVKHADATRAEVRVFVEDGMLRIEVRDDGIGGADPKGHGLVGLSDRATALGGWLRIDSPVGGGTLVAAEMPISSG